MDDGSVVISILGDRKHIAKELEKTSKDIEKTEKKLTEKISEKSGLEAKLEDAQRDAKETSDKIRELKKEYRDLSRVMESDKTSAADYSRAVNRQAAITKELSIQRPILKAQDADADRLHAKYESVTDEVERLTSELTVAKEKAQDLANQADQAKVGEAVRKQLDKASTSLERFERRMLRIGRSVLFYNIISSALRSAVSYYGSLLKNNQEYSAQLAKLKGALLTAFDPLISRIIPWAVSLLQILTSVVQVVGNLISLLFGGTLLGSAKSAEAMNKQAKAIGAVGSAAKEAGKQLASFDQINKLNSDKDSGGGSGDSSIGADFSDYDKFQSEEYQRELNRLTAILSGALLALGAILFFSGANIPLGLGLMAAGAVGLANLATGKWGEVTDELQKTLTRIFLILAGSFLVIGAILAFSGTGPLNIARGIAMMAIGASALVGAAYLNWDYLKTILTGTVGEIITGISMIVLVIGIVLAFSGHIGIGLGMILTSATALAAAAYVNWDSLTEALKQSTGDIMLIASITLVIGIILTFSGANLHVGIGLMAIGAAGLAAEATLNWEGLIETLRENTGLICAIEGIILVIGILLVFTGVATPLGMALIVAGAAGLATEVAVNWDTWKDTILSTANTICEYGGSILIAVGAMLLFSGANIPLGIGLILGGIATKKLAEEIPWNDNAAKTELDGVLGQICAVSGSLLVAIGLILVFSGAGIPLGLGMLAAGAEMLYSEYSKDYNDSGIIDLTEETERKIAQKQVAKSRVETAERTGMTAGQFVGDMMSMAREMNMSAEMLYQALTEDMHMSDADLRALGFEIGGDGMNSYIFGYIEGAEKNTESVSDILSRSLKNSVMDAFDSFNNWDINSAQAAHSLNFRLVEMMENGMITKDEIEEVFADEEVQNALNEMGLSFQDGYIQGMGEGDEVAKAAKKLVNSGLDAIAETQDSHSPSKKTAVLGKDAVDGYVNEIVDNADLVKSAGETMVDSLTNGMTNRMSMFDAVLIHIVDSANAMANAVVYAANSAVTAMTSMSYSGSTVRIPTPTLYALSIPTLPKLATGAVIPPNAPFAAILGDQRSGTNVETPLSTIQQAVADVLRGEDLLDAIKDQNRLLQRILEKCGDVKLDGRSVTESVNSYQRQMDRASGGDGYGSI